MEDQSLPLVLSLFLSFFPPSLFPPSLLLFLPLLLFHQNLLGKEEKCGNSVVLSRFCECHGLFSLFFSVVVACGLMEQWLSLSLYFLELSRGAW